MSWYRVVALFHWAIYMGIHASFNRFLSFLFYFVPQWLYTVTMLRQRCKKWHPCLCYFFSPCFVSVFPSGMIEVYDSILFDPQNNPRQCQPGFCLWSTCWEIKVYDFMQHQLLLCLVNLNWISRAVLKLTLATMIGEDEFNLHRYWLENDVI